MTLDLTKPVQTRDGRPARIICTDARLHGGPWVMALAKREDGSEHQVFGTDDLVNAPVKHTGWLVIYPSHEFTDRHAASVYHTEASAKASASVGGGVVLPIEWQEPA